MGTKREGFFSREWTGMGRECRAEGKKNFNHRFHGLLGWDQEIRSDFFPRIHANGREFQTEGKGEFNHGFHGLLGWEGTGKFSRESTRMDANSKRRGKENLTTDFTDYSDGNETGRIFFPRMDGNGKGMPSGGEEEF